jgi:hypothetical protein
MRFMFFRYALKCVVASSTIFHLCMNYIIFVWNWAGVLVKQTCNVLLEKKRKVFSVLTVPWTIIFLLGVLKNGLS